MKVDKTEAIAFLVAMGFEKAGEWDDEKLTKRLSVAPEKVDIEEVPEEHEDFFKKLVEAGGEVELTGGAEPETEEEEEADEAPPKKEKKEKKEKKGSKVKNKKKAKKSTASKSNGKVERDAFGCAKGTISFKVNKVMTQDWMTEEEIAEAAGVTLDQARGRLYYAAEEGQMEHRKLIQYKLAKPKKATAKK